MPKKFSNLTVSYAAGGYNALRTETTRPAAGPAHSPPAFLPNPKYAGHYFSCNRNAAITPLPTEFGDTDFLLRNVLAEARNPRPF